jgi:hypothetical protein
MLLPDQQIETFAEERQAIETRFAQLFDSTQTPVQYGNVNVLKQGVQSIVQPFKVPAYVQLRLVGGPSEQQEVNRNITTINGLININVYASKESGSQLARTIADSVWPIYNATRFNGITTGAASLRELPITDGWYTLNLSIPYRWQRCITSP